MLSVSLAFGQTFRHVQREQRMIHKGVHHGTYQDSEYQKASEYSKKGRMR